MLNEANSNVLAQLEYIGIYKVDATITEAVDLGKDRREMDGSGWELMLDAVQTVRNLLSDCHRGLVGDVICAIVQN